MHNWVDERLSPPALLHVDCKNWSLRCYCWKLRCASVLTHWTAAGYILPSASTWLVVGESSEALYRWVQRFWWKRPLKVPYLVRIEDLSQWECVSTLQSDGTRWIFTRESQNSMRTTCTHNQGSCLLLELAQVAAVHFFLSGAATVHPQGHRVRLSLAL